MEKKREHQVLGISSDQLFRMKSMGLNHSLDLILDLNQSIGSEREKRKKARKKRRRRKKILGDNVNVLDTSLSVLSDCNEHEEDDLCELNQFQNEEDLFSSPTIQQHNTRKKGRNVGKMSAKYLSHNEYVPYSHFVSLLSSRFQYDPIGLFERLSCSKNEKRRRRRRKRFVRGVDELKEKLKRVGFSLGDGLVLKIAIKFSHPYYDPLDDGCEENGSFYPIMYQNEKDHEPTMNRRRRSDTCNNDEIIVDLWGLSRGVCQDGERMKSIKSYLKKRSDNCYVGKKNDSSSLHISISPSTTFYHQQQSPLSSPIRLSTTRSHVFSPSKLSFDHFIHKITSSSSSKKKNKMMNYEKKKRDCEMMKYSSFENNQPSLSDHGSFNPPLLPHSTRYELRNHQEKSEIESSVDDHHISPSSTTISSSHPTMLLSFQDPYDRELKREEDMVEIFGERTSRRRDGGKKSSHKQPSYHDVNKGRKGRKFIDHKETFIWG